MSISRSDPKIQKIRAAERELERKQRELQRGLVQLDAVIKQRAQKKASMIELKGLCKRRVVLQRGIERMASTISKLQSVEHAIMQASINQSILNAQRAATNGMREANQGMNMGDVMRTQQEFLREQQKSELVNEQLENAFTMSGEEEEEVNDEVAKVLMEVAGVQIQGMNIVPVGGLTQEDTEVDSILKELGI